MKNKIGLSIILITTLSFGQICFGQTLTGLVYDLKSDDYYSIKYNRKYSGTDNEFVTKYTIYHPTKGYAWMTVTATHDKMKKEIKVSVDDTNEGIFSHINDEEIKYDSASIEPIGSRGMAGVLGGKRIPNQITVKFVSAKYENVKVVHIMGSAKSEFSNAYYFILDEKN